MQKRVKFIIHKRKNESTGLSRYSEALLKYLGRSVDPLEINFTLPLSLKGIFEYLNIDLESVLNHFPPYIKIDDSPNCVWHFTNIFVFPSKYEGFGLPVLEAMSCGVPVICSNATSLPEVGGESVLYFDPDKPEELANHIDRVLHDNELKKNLISSGLKRSKDFSWHNVAQKTKEVYNKF